MITDLEKISQIISSWIKDLCTNAGIKTLVVNISDFRSATVALLCKKTGLETICIEITSHLDNSLCGFASQYSIPYYHVVIDDFGADHSVATMPLDADISFFSDSKGHIYNISNWVYNTADILVIDNVVKSTGGLVVGDLCRTNIHIVRDYQKHLYYADVLPLGDLFISEVVQLYSYLSKNSYELSTRYGIAYDEIEWADREDMKGQLPPIGNVWNAWVDGIIFNDQDPAKSPNFCYYTSRQQEVIAQLHQREKLTRHKRLNLPICKFDRTKGYLQ